jgi:hypothetical protein
MLVVIFRDLYGLASKTFKLSSDPLFVDKVRDIAGLYLSPPNRALVLSIEDSDTGSRASGKPSPNTLR